MAEKTFFWNRENAPTELHALLMALQDEYPVAEGAGDIELVFKSVADKGALKVSCEDNSAVIAYNGINCAARGVGAVMAGVEGDENIVFETLGIMLDCSRNAVMTVEHFKKWLRRLALMGYNMAMLYTEDTYKLPDEPYFGYMRGPYTLEEMKEVDAYAKSLGIEMIACIQTLGHLEQILRWGAYNKVKDTSSVLLVDEEETYKLIDKMIAFWSEAFESRRVHIGMDETHDLGRGAFMDKFGYERGFDIFNRHLAKVEKMCEQYGLKSMIWSDMYFRMGNERYDYYGKDTVIPEDVKNKIPKNVELVYWDYYHRDKDFYTDWIQRHRDLGYEPLMGSGAWTWSRFWYDHQITSETVGPCLEACREAKLKEVFFTMWGDDGAYCEFDSVLAGLAWAAELSFGGCGCDDKLEKTFKAVCGGSYAAHIAASGLERYDGEFNYQLPGQVWDDALLGIMDNELRKRGADVIDQLIERYRDVAAKLENSLDDNKAGDISYAYKLAKFLIAKLELRKALVAAYDARDRDGLRKVKDQMVPETIDACRTFAKAFRAQWLRRNKAAGMDVIQIRLAGLVARLEEAALRIEEYLNGDITEIIELESRHNLTEGDLQWGSSYATFGSSSASRW